MQAIEFSFISQEWAKYVFYSSHCPQAVLHMQDSAHKATDKYIVKPVCNDTARI
jgi:hypothetical protein